MEITDYEFKGYSRRARDPEFIAQIRKIRKKAFIKNLMITIIFAALTTAAAVILIQAKTASELSAALAVGAAAAFAALPVFAVLTVIRIFLTVGSRQNISALDKDGYELTVENSQQKETEVLDHDKRWSYKTKSTAVALRNSAGKIQKNKDDRVSQYAAILKNGDKVYYHPGFPYPIELYDKSNGNICVFCGKINPPGQSTCEKCSRPLLV